MKYKNCPTIAKHIFQGVETILMGQSEILFFKIKRRIRLRLNTDGSRLTIIMDFINIRLFFHYPYKQHLRFSAHSSNSLYKRSKVEFALNGIHMHCGVEIY